MQILGIILEKQHKDGFQGTLAEIEPVVSLQNGSIKCNLAIVRVMFEGSQRRKHFHYLQKRWYLQIHE